MKVEPAQAAIRLPRVVFATLFIIHSLFQKPALPIGQCRI